MPELLAHHTTLRVGGAAKRWARATDEHALVAAVRSAGDDPVLLLGGGSNIVAADAGFDGLVIQVATTGVTRTDVPGGVRLEIQAGVEWDQVVLDAVEQQLAGIECLSGIPGTVGATPIQNVGAYGQEVSRVITAVRVLDRQVDEIRQLPAAACEFDYRASLFKRLPDRFVVLAVTFELIRSPVSGPINHDPLAQALGIPYGASAPLALVRDAVLAQRRIRGMVIDVDDPDTASAGSFFLNPIVSDEEFAAFRRRAARLGLDPPFDSAKPGHVKLHAAWLIENAGFSKGQGDPRGIAISAKHALALTNRGDGTAADLIALAHEIAARVRETFGVTLAPEPEFVGHTWSDPSR